LIKTEEKLDNAIDQMNAYITKLDNTSNQLNKDLGDIDSDGDGVPDKADVFPNDPNESSDKDGNGI